MLYCCIVSAHFYCTKCMCVVSMAAGAIVFGAGEKPLAMASRDYHIRKNPAKQKRKSHKDKKNIQTKKKIYSYVPRYITHSMISA